MNTLRLRRLPLLLLVLAALSAAAGLVACGEEDEGDEEVEALLDDAFSQPIDSADVTLTVDAELEGGEGASDPIRVQLGGPYSSNGPNRIPSFDFDGALQGFGAQLPGIGLISTGKNLYLEVQGIAYALGRRVVARESRALGSGDEAEAGLAVLGLEPREWIESGEIEEGVDVAGVPTTHVAASVDVAALVADLNQSAEIVPEVGAGPAPALSEDQLEALDEAIADPRLDLFVGEEDDTLRRLALTLGFDVADEDQAALGGVGSGTASFSIEFANVNEGQRIEAPRNVRPLAELASQVAGLGALFGLPEIPGLTAPGPRGRGGGDEGGEAGGGSLGGSGAIDEVFQRYGKCLEAAGLADQAALERCNELLLR